MDQAWVFGPILCDLWHSVDVLASTSSILHLCVISLDRCPGITSSRDYLKIHNWLGGCPLKWDHNVSELLSLKWTHGRLHHVIFLPHVCAPCGGVKCKKLIKGGKRINNVWCKYFFSSFSQNTPGTGPSQTRSTTRSRWATRGRPPWSWSSGCAPAPSPSPPSPGGASLPRVSGDKLGLQTTEAFWILLSVVCVGQACQRSMSNCQRLANFYEASVGWPPRIYRKGLTFDDIAVSFSLNIMLTDVK